jgi:hypothetical protein
VSFPRPLSWRGILVAGEPPIVVNVERFLALAVTAAMTAAFAASASGRESAKSEHKLTIRQVQSAFAAEGVPLRRIKIPTPGRTAFECRERCSLIALVVYGSVADAKRTQVNSASLTAGSKVLKSGRAGNVLAAYAPGAADGRRIESALRKLKREALS